MVHSLSRTLVFVSLLFCVNMKALSWPENELRQDNNCSLSLHSGSISGLSEDPSSQCRSCTNPEEYGAHRPRDTLGRLEFINPPLAIYLSGSGEFHTIPPRHPFPKSFSLSTSKGAPETVTLGVVAQRITDILNLAVIVGKRNFEAAENHNTSVEGWGESFDLVLLEEKSNEFLQLLLKKDPTGVLVHDFFENYVKDNAVAILESIVRENSNLEHALLLMNRDSYSPSHFVGDQKTEYSMFWDQGDSKRTGRGWYEDLLGTVNRRLTFENIKVANIVAFLGTNIRVVQTSSSILESALLPPLMRHFEDSYYIPNDARKLFLQIQNEPQFKQYLFSELQRPGTFRTIQSNRDGSLREKLAMIDVAEDILNESVPGERGASADKFRNLDWWGLRGVSTPLEAAIIASIQFQNLPVLKELLTHFDKSLRTHHISFLTNPKSDSSHESTQITPLELATVLGFSEGVDLLKSSIYSKLKESGDVNWARMNHFILRRPWARVNRFKNIEYLTTPVTEIMAALILGEGDSDFGSSRSIRDGVVTYKFRSFSGEVSKTLNPQAYFRGTKEGVLQLLENLNRMEQAFHYSENESDVKVARSILEVLDPNRNFSMEYRYEILDHNEVFKLMEAGHPDGPLELQTVSLRDENVVPSRGVSNLEEFYTKAWEAIDEPPQEFKVLTNLDPVFTVPFNGSRGVQFLGVQGVPLFSIDPSPPISWSWGLNASNDKKTAFQITYFIPSPPWELQKSVVRFVDVDANPRVGSSSRNLSVAPRAGLFIKRIRIRNYGASTENVGPF